MDIVEDQELEAPPYDITDNGLSTKVVVSDFTQVNPGYDGTASVPVVKTIQCFVPAGIFALTSTADDTAAGVLINVLGIVRCKDMA